MSSCTVIIPVFNQAALTAQCLDTLLAQDTEKIIVVDDASTDATSQLLNRYRERIQIITHQVNRGFATSCNDGAAAADGEYLVFLNNDTLPSLGWLDILVRYMRVHTQVVMVGSKLVYPNNTIQHAGVVIGQDRYPRHIYSGFPIDHPAVNKSRRFQIVTAACTLIRQSIFKSAGGFDPAFYNGFEDVDLCLRLGEHGYEIHYCADSVVCHLESVSPGRFRQDRHNVALYRERWMNRVQPDDLNYYLEDQLLQLSYEGRYPIRLDISPMLATLEQAERGQAVEHALRTRSQEVAELLRENIRLSIELGARATDSPALYYQQLRNGIHSAIQQIVPRGATVLVVSKGDSTLLELPGCQGWHFPQTAHGTYAGHHPANSQDAIAHLENLRAKGAEYLLLPSTAYWWLNHYSEFCQHLEACCRCLKGPDDICRVYQLTSAPQDKVNNARNNTVAHALQHRPKRHPKSHHAPPSPSEVEALRRQLIAAEAELGTCRSKLQWLQSALANQQHARQMLEAAIAANYSETITQIRNLVKVMVPSDAIVLVVSKGDPELLNLNGRRAWHFPQDDNGNYAGYYPADSHTAIQHLQTLVKQGGQFLLLPNTAFWWLEHYRDLEAFLRRFHTQVWRNDSCILYQLSNECYYESKPEQITSVDVTIPKIPPAQTNFPDLVCFPIINWSYRFQRPQQLMLQFAHAGHRVFYVSHDFRKAGKPYILRRLAERLFEVSLRGPKFEVRQDMLETDSCEMLLSVLDSLHRDCSLKATVAMVQLPFWWPLVKQTAARFAWPVVYDCMDWHEGFSTSHPLLVDQEHEMLSQANLVVVSSSMLEAKASNYNQHVLLLHNACDYYHFAKAEGGSREGRPIIGYYGAIAEWFDADLVAALAHQRPDWNFVLIGSIQSADVSCLSQHPNISLPGEKPYAEIPDWLSSFDVTILPFKRLPLTEAVNPVKAYEIFASGKPLVSVPLPEMLQLVPLVRIASSPAEFEQAIETELRHIDVTLKLQRQAFARDNTWRSRYETLSPKIHALFARAPIVEPLALERVLRPQSHINTYSPYEC